MNSNRKQDLPGHRRDKNHFSRVQSKNQNVFLKHNQIKYLPVEPQLLSQVYYERGGKREHRYHSDDDPPQHEVDNSHPHEP